MDTVLTIFTPTYNRKNRLVDLYDSLMKQTCSDFKWLIVDDGSTDNTEDLVKQWIDENNIKINYSYQNNAGKIRALERGIHLCKTPWMICVDSDDCITEDAVASMLADINSLDDAGIGVIYPQRMSNEPFSKWIPNDIDSVNIMDIKHLYGINETAILFRTEYLRKIDIPFFAGEKFLSEEILYIQLSKYGAFVPRNKVFYLSNYQSDGLTKNLFRIWERNPKGTICLLQNRFLYCGRYAFWDRVKNRIKCIMNLNAFCMAIGCSWYQITPNKMYSLLLYFPSRLWRRIRFK